MKRSIILTIAILFTLTAHSQQKSINLLQSRGEIVVSINKNDFNKIPNNHSWSIHKIDDAKLSLYLNSIQHKQLTELNIPYVEEAIPSMKENIKMGKSTHEMQQWDSYPDYDSYLSFMLDLQTKYTDLCVIDTIGYSTQNRLLLALKISGNKNTSNKPNFLYTSSIHGDELAGYVLLLRLADYLLSNYSNDTYITNLMDEVDIYINPLANPDGTFASGNHTVVGATRGNANFIDLNRNFPDPDKGEHPDGNEWQVETIAMMDYMKERAFEMAMNLHGGAEVVNYPWDTWEKLHADNDWYHQICRNYADTVHSYNSNYLTDQDNGITNGYAWYSVAGGRQDYSNYFLGTREVLTELSEIKLLPPEELPNLWEYNYRSMLQYIDNASYGIHGSITNEEGEPIQAKITVLNHDKDNSEVFTNEEGIFYRYLSEGSYDIEISAAGYYSKTVSDVEVLTNEKTPLELILTSKTSAINQAASNIKVFPNPSKSSQAIYIQNSSFQNTNCYLLSSKGKLLEHISSSQKIIKIASHKGPGAYFVKIQSDTYTITKKIIVY